MISFTVFNTEIKVSLITVLLMILWCVTGNSVIMTASLIAVLLHELAHMAASYLLGMNTSRLTLYPFGGAIDIENTGEVPSYDILVALIGPLFSFMLGYISSKIKVDLFEEISSVSYAVGVFNLIPIYPLDGGRIVASVLTVAFGRSKGNKISSAISKALAVVFFAYSAFMLIGFGKSTTVVMAFFILVSAFGRHTPYLRLDKRKDVVEHSDRIKLIKTDASCTQLEMLKKVNGPEYHIFVVTENGKTVKIVDEITLAEKMFN